MSERYPGGIISKTAPTPTGPYESGTAPGIWSLEQQMQYQQQGVWPTAGLTPNYIEDVFSTYLYTGNNSTQTITNGIDLSTKGGLVWLKARNNAQNNFISDTVIGRGASRSSNSTLADAAETLGSTGIQSFNSTGFTVNLYSNFGSGSEQAGINNSANNMVSWTFRKQPKFFDIQTYTGTGVAGKIVTHNLGSVPGCIMVKKTSGAEQWSVYHVGAGSVWTLILDDTSARDITNNFNYTNGLTSTEFQVGSNTPTNENGATYVAYLFAHNAGGFGLTGTDNVISCGSYVSNGSRISVTLGWEPQWILIKKATGASNNWTIVDSMRGLTANATNASAPLFPNLSDAETASSSTDGPAANATGFSVPYSSSAFNYPSGETYIYIAIRRGPMKVPTSGTSVFSPNLETTSTNPQTLTTGFPVDLSILTVTTGTNRQVSDRLRGGSTSSFTYLLTDSTAAETTFSGFGLGYDNNTGIVDSSTLNQPNAIFWNFRRAPSFFDEVCYTGTGSVTNYSHNLSAVPELMIMKKRSATGNWNVYSKTLGVTGNDVLFFNSDPAGSDGGVFWNSTVPTSSVFTLGTGANINGSGVTFVAYLFATCAGVSKVGSYTGNGSTQTIDCGFTGGARFVLIKRTDSTGDWYVYDTARGMTVLTDPYLLLNTTAAQTATLGSVTTVSTGFALDSTILAAINVSAATYIFLAIA